MIFIAIVIFIATAIIVFHPRICEGLVIKHFLVFSSISAALVILDPANYKATIWSSTLLCMAGIYYTARELYNIVKQVKAFK